MPYQKWFSICVQASMGWFKFRRLEPQEPQRFSGSGPGSGQIMWLRVAPATYLIRWLASWLHDPKIDCLSDFLKLPFNFKIYHRSPNKHLSYFLVSVCCISCTVSCFFSFHLVLVWVGFNSGVIQERCLIEGLQAWPHNGIAPPISIHFYQSIFYCLPANCPTEPLLQRLMVAAPLTPWMNYLKECFHHSYTYHPFSNIRLLSTSYTPNSCHLFLHPIL